MSREIIELRNPISYKFFNHTARTLFAYASTAFQTELEVQVNAYSRPQFFQQCVEPGVAAIEKEENDRHIFAMTDTLFGRDILLEENFNRAKEVTVRLQPKDPSLAPAYAFALATYKDGGNPKKVHFYIQGGEADYDLRQALNLQGNHDRGMIGRFFKIPRVVEHFVRF